MKRSTMIDQLEKWRARRAGDPGSRPETKPKQTSRKAFLWDKAVVTPEPAHRPPNMTGESASPAPKASPPPSVTAKEIKEYVKKVRTQGE